MNRRRIPLHKRSLAAVLLAFAVVLAPFGSAHAYVGPGLGLGTLMVILGFLGSLLLAVFGIFWYPIKRVLKKRKAASQAEAARTHQDEVQPEEQEATNP